MDVGDSGGDKAKEEGKSEQPCTARPHRGQGRGMRQWKEGGLRSSPWRKGAEAKGQVTVSSSSRLLASHLSLSLANEAGEH